KCGAFHVHRVHDPVATRCLHRPIEDPAAVRFDGLGGGGDVEYAEVDVCCFRKRQQVTSDETLLFCRTLTRVMRWPPQPTAVGGMRIDSSPLHDRRLCTTTGSANRRARIYGPKSRSDGAMPSERHSRTVTFVT